MKTRLEDAINSAKVFEFEYTGPGPHVLSAQKFIDGFVPPDYLIDEILQRRYLYTLTAPTGHGKTAVALEMALRVATGTSLGGRAVEAGRVLYMAGENPDDVRARLMVAVAKRGLNLADLRLSIIDGPSDLQAGLAEVSRQVEALGGVVMVIIDTAAAHFRGDDDNSNTQIGAFARDHLRPYTRVLGGPTVLVPAHPVKNPNRDNLVPRGGGAFLNEVDGNLRLWSEVRGTTELHWFGKLRGPGFEPLMFGLDVVTDPCLADSKGRMLPTVMAECLSNQEAERKAGQQRSDEDGLLDAMATFPNGSMADWCRQLGWTRADGEPQKSKVGRLLERLERDRLVKNVRGRWNLTKEGKDEASRDGSSGRYKPR